MSKKIGVLLPVYKNDNLEYFKLSINSILEQTYTNFIIFVGVDGEVGNEMQELLTEYDKNSQIQVCWFKNNRGLACVLNDLINKSKEYSCDFYARMDADDIAINDRFEEQIKFLEENNEVDVVGGAIEEIDESSNKKDKKVAYPKTHQDCKSFFRYRDPLAHPAVMFSKTFFEKVKGYREEYRKNQDTMLWFDGFKNDCIFANLEKTVLLFRVNDDFYANRRNGWQRAKKMFQDRVMINKELGYGFEAHIFAVMMLLMTISPSFVKKIAYKIFR